MKVTPQYRNMADGLAKEPRAVAFAEEAMRRAGLEPKLTIVRGGTDGSRLTELGLPTPNLSTRRAQPAFAAGVDLPGRDGDGGAGAGGAGEGLGRTGGVSPLMRRRIKGLTPPARRRIHIFIPTASATLRHSAIICRNAAGVSAW